MTTQMTVFLSSLGVLAATAIAYALMRYRQKRARNVGSVSEIRLYPIKSCPPLFLTSAECTETGLKYKNVHDRQFVLVGEKGFIAIRANLKLLELQVEYDEVKDCLVLQAPGMKSCLHIPLQAPEFDSSKVKSFVWYDKRETFYYDYGAEYSEWFTEYLGEQCSLGYAHANISREINPEMTYNHDPVHNDTRLLYPNSHPYLVANQASLEDLNSRLKEQVTMSSFRPNIIVGQEGASTSLRPYEEDDWRVIRIGGRVTMCNARPCPRCPMIYVDYDKRELRANKEPMTTLLKYRRGQEKKDQCKTVFGINAAVKVCGHFSLGDNVSVTAAR
ncbi:mitochondrial amidoxime reducing component 2-like [Watersipora subatra]|uniref:mitochondrial amidoxime reducing component 2-like n=1 Tax=Watersipora subatra TaxID=2589382 RepID=UPI00355B2913